jgi:pimeloyl-ACP methyl ester carboxylesterase
MRARDPDVEGHVRCDGLNIGYQVFGDAAPALLLLPTWTIIHSRFWKLQVPYLARHFCVITFDRPGNGRSERESRCAATFRTSTGTWQQAIWRWSKAA